MLGYLIQVLASTNSLYYVNSLVALTIGVVYGKSSLNLHTLKENAKGCPAAKDP